ncbi:hypothetical protein WN55_05640 [Dufourea novaeangliae]|uniref:Uncharacterized protein n=1 Tax=Dufourea novaeangliae TaxID=178035 RepID=A0A154PNC0_DUFNO|nr:hypothetical protein WN55_05640 [Dufourea novaeangliae]
MMLIGEPHRLILRNKKKRRKIGLIETEIGTGIDSSCCVTVHLYFCSRFEKNARTNSR